MGISIHLFLLLFILNKQKHEMSITVLCCCCCYKGLIAPLIKFFDFPFVPFLVLACPCFLSLVKLLATGIYEIIKKRNNFHFSNHSRWLCLLCKQSTQEVLFNACIYIIHSINVRRIVVGLSAYSWRRVWYYTHTYRFHC